MSAKKKKKERKNTALNKIEAVFSIFFRYLYKNFLFGVFSLIPERFFKFLLVGILNTLFAYTIYALLITIGLNVNLALFLQYIAGVLWNFKTTGALVFKNSDNKLLLKFILSYFFTFLLNSVLLKFLISYVNGYIAQAVLVMPIAVISFLIFKFWVFK